MLRALGDELGRMPTARDIDERRGQMPSKSLYWHTFGSLARALREAGYDVAVGEERLERAVGQGASSRGGSAGCPSSPTGPPPGAESRGMLTEWQVYRMFESRRGAWATFQFLVRQRLLDEGTEVRKDGALVP